MSQQDPVVIIGAGVGGLAASLALSTRGVPVTVIESRAETGGKVRQLQVGGAAIDSGPTVFTLRGVFDALFETAGTDLASEVQLTRAETLARHAWPDGSGLDLFADGARSAAAIGDFAGAAEARRYQAFCDSAALTYRSLERSFLRAQRPSPLSLTARILGEWPGGLRHIHPFTSLWGALRGHFQDPRLQQLFGRYATYCGSSPFLAPATLSLIAHVEQSGVWTLTGGMGALTAAMQRVAEARGVTFMLGETVTGLGLERGRVSHVTTASGARIPCRAAICNGDPAALRAGLLGDTGRRAVAARAPRRSLSAITWSALGTAGGLPLSHHNVFFSSDYRREFEQILRHQRPPDEPTIYICAMDRAAQDRAAREGAAQDRAAREGASPGTPERLLCLINAPANGDRHPYPEEEIAACSQRVQQQLARCGLELKLSPAHTRITTPADFARLFPATGGALYGSPSHGWRGSFTRPGARSRIPGLYLAGGGVHPGPGVPMTAISGCLAAEQLLRDLTSRSRSSTVATAGGTSMPAATTASMRLP